MRAPARLINTRQAIAISRTNGTPGERNGGVFGQAAAVTIAIIQSVIFVFEDVSYRDRFVFVDSPFCALLSHH
jgi:hypothetical protein